VPHRVYYADEGRFVDFEAMLADAARADVLIIGEHHGDPAVHGLELAALEGLARRKRAVVLSLEMFERDVQPRLDDYLGGRIAESAFLEGARPWPRYRSDYRPLVELADSNAWPVLAANAPRRIANEVSQRGLAAIERLNPGDRALVAADLQCPLDDAYFRRFETEMRAHPDVAKKTARKARPTSERLYLAQCIKDETMAESIARAHAGESPSLVVHINGSFHSDYGQGVVARAKRRLPGAAITVVSAIRVEDLDQIDTASFGSRADYLLFTLAPAAVSDDDVEEHGGLVRR